jgi:hypothetical protein
MTDDDAYVDQLRQRLAALEAEIAALGLDPARDASRHALEARASYIRHKLNAPDAYHGPDWRRRLAVDVAASS